MHRKYIKTMKYLFNINVSVNTGAHRCSDLARHNVNSFTSWPSHVIGPLWLWVQLHCLHLPLICLPVFVHDRSRCDWLPTLCDPRGAEGLIGIFKLNTKYGNERYDAIMSQSVVNLLQVSLWPASGVDTYFSRSYCPVVVYELSVS